MRFKREKRGDKDVDPDVAVGLRIPKSLYDEVKRIANFKRKSVSAFIRDHLQFCIQPDSPEFFVTVLSSDDLKSLVKVGELLELLTKSPELVDLLKKHKSKEVHCE